ncbi:MAG: guanylate kinase [Gammaproteobacteria bacterium]|nr:MAG: guanylate kinase [Gammaproteobacteria bacterium]
MSDSRATGQLFVVSAPSGAGKTSLVNELVTRHEDLAISVSHTTRPPRPGEQEGIDYHFVSEEQFREMVRRDAFLEHAEVFGNLYGTSREWVQAQLAQGISLILEIDWQGARQIREKMPDCTAIFILPPSLDELERRLRGRGGDGEEVIRRRMEAAVLEMEHYREYEYLIINDDFHRALGDLESVIRGAGLRRELQERRHRQLIASLLGSAP